MGTLSHSNRIVLLQVLFILILALPGCMPANNAQEGFSKPCTPEVITSLTNNPYIIGNTTNENLAALSEGIYTRFVNGDVDAQNIALAMLGIETKKWAAFTDIPYNNTLYRLTVIYLHPDLVRVIVLNELIGTGVKNVSYADTVQSAMRGLAERSETMFFIVVTSSSLADPGNNTSPAVMGDFKPSGFHLENTNAEQVAPLHAERMMEHPINLANSFGSALVGYPIFIIRNEQCEPFLNARYDTKLVMHMDTGSIGGESVHGMTFPVPYAAALDITHENPAIIPNISGILSELPKRYAPKDTPPLPEYGQNLTDSKRFLYWIDTGRYLWYDLTQSNRPVDFSKP